MALLCIKDLEVGIGVVFFSPSKQNKVLNFKDFQLYIFW